MAKKIEVEPGEKNNESRELWLNIADRNDNGPIEDTDRDNEENDTEIDQQE